MLRKWYEAGTVTDEQGDPLFLPTVVSFIGIFGVEANEKAAELALEGLINDGERTCSFCRLPMQH